MTVTNETTTKALAILDRCNLNAAKSGQTAVWAQIINDAIPAATDATMFDAIRSIAATRTSDGKGGSWVTVGDLIAKMRTIRHTELEKAEREARQIEAAQESSPVDVKRLMAEARRAGNPSPELVNAAKARAKAAMRTTKENTP